MRKALVALCLLALLAPMAIASPALPVQAAEDWDIPGGHFYTQTGGGGGKGFSVTDEGGVRFWGEFQRLGGVQGVGYPVSQRFDWDGFSCQAMQRVVFQWRADIGQVYFVNVFDLMSGAGKDGWLLASRQTPKPLGPDFDGGLAWDQKVAKRLALLDANPAIKNKYYEVVGDPVQMNGLPTSAVTDMGNNYTLRAQRVVIQQWKEDVPWAAKGQVTVGLGGSIAGEAGILPNPLALNSIPDPLAGAIGALPPTMPAGMGALLPTATPTLPSGMGALLPTVTPAMGGLPGSVAGSKKIAFVSERDGNLEIYTMNTDGTGVTRITNNLYNDQDPAWSPDGKKIVFTSSRDGNNEIYIMNADGTSQTRLTNNAANDTTARFSPDGSKIVFISERDGTSRLWAINSDGTNPKKVADNTAFAGEWSPDGTVIAYSGNPPPSDICCEPQ
jgi:hypothetical protein